ncbi:MAG: DUF2891 domain-containing protein [Bacteroidales bacterium]|nr:DUF2891 domain-containing protein [Bacteroidales bacterium]
MNHKFRLVYFVFIVILLMGTTLILIGISNKKKKSKMEAELKIEDIFLKLSTEKALFFSKLALNCISREYPNKPGHVINDSSEVLSPETLHPAFYGCFDWHSSVHGHWMLVRLLRMFPDLPNADKIRKAISGNLTAENILQEVRYLDQPNRKSFERTYGWAWLLKLAEELQSWQDTEAKLWAKNLEPLTQVVVELYLEFLPKQDYPIRRGVHPNTAFGLSFALDYARQSGNTELEDLIIKRSMVYYANDKNAPAAWEPDGDDFFSPCLQEANLMRRVLKPDEFVEWFENYLPGLKAGQPKNLLYPASVSDRSDPKIVHLDGLNLSRAWCMFEIAKILPENHAARDMLIASGTRHANATLPHISSGMYEGEHWLASFAVYLLSTIE